MARKSSKAKERLGKKIKRFRKDRGYSQEQLAEILNISRTHMGHLEQGRKSPSLDLLRKIALTLKVKLSEIVD